jgi:hypothetical protein
MKTVFQSGRLTAKYTVGAWESERPRGDRKTGERKGFKVFCTEIGEATGLVGYLSFSKSLDAWRWWPDTKTEVLTGVSYESDINALLAEINAPDLKHEFYEIAVWTVSGVQEFRSQKEIRELMRELIDSDVVITEVSRSSRTIGERR